MKRLYNANMSSRISRTKWDILALSVILLILCLFVWSTSGLGGTVDYTNQVSVQKHSAIALDIWLLPYYTAETTIRMFIGLGFSLLITFIFGALAAKSKRAENIIIPAVDILQSIPILGFFAITITGFLVLFPTSLWGAQSAVIFGIITAQVWNMILSFYQSLKTVPKELREAADMYQLSAWQRFWKLEVPFSMPGLVWNTMMSMSACWFMVVASETIVVNFSASQSIPINLPGIGSFIDAANNARDFGAVGAAIVMMLVTIVLYDQLLFRPLVAWSEKFTLGENQSEVYTESWFLKVLQKSAAVKFFTTFFSKTTSNIVNIKFLKKDLSRAFNQKKHHKAEKKETILNQILWYTITSLVLFALCYFAYQTVFGGNSDIGITQTIEVFGYGLATGLRVVVLIVITSIIWVPIGVWIGMRPRIAQKVQPYAQMAAAFPVNVLYGVFGTLVITFDLNFNIWCIVLMALGTQWYILFNVIAGASAIPDELKLAASNMQLKGFTKWKKFLFPAVMPYYVTGAITAAGGAWNASIVCEYINWGKNSIIQASGLGAYITDNTNIQGDHTANVLLGVIVMCVLVVASNKLFWRRLYNYAENRFSMNM
ncbi:ABC transporter permease [Francisella adeliensis]|uniref:ABC transporter permease subunit n=1 Tax=Francisella adeliensis TaxID=2007306 RepID=A0A2Z4XXC8_9GAMM|nr:ABC transporter permease subunit [Francisella adeliensis]AXA33055.1 sulfonate ABC transporter permease [Francisella adeliensis]MBK2086057.1 ABC transporter permease subunit [Francisella adeliensis]MBK2096779.1 ABC transporter permease subunit [Francisella adeliensis]QIW11282.1 ABC transporter permease subunit [Francisella adeliensis]QIW13158.1 ABC transporter permease subunit [Francisella adeliensis]